MARCLLRTRAASRQARESNAIRYAREFLKDSVPRRIQLSRKKGFNLQRESRRVNGLEAVNCARPARYGNPFVIQFDSHFDYTPKNAAEAVTWHREWIDRGLSAFVKAPKPPTIEEIRRDLRGKNLACWCPLVECDTCGYKPKYRSAPLWADAGAPCDKLKCAGKLRRSPCHVDTLLKLANE